MSTPASVLGQPAVLGSSALSSLKLLRHLSAVLGIAEQAAAIAAERGIARERRSLYVFVVAELFRDFVYHARALIQTRQFSARLGDALLNVLDARMCRIVIYLWVGKNSRRKRGQRGCPKHRESDSSVA